MNPSRLPRMFVGSSTEGLEVAYAIQENLDFDAEVEVWNQGIFNPSSAILHKLLNCLAEFDFAAFVISADDILEMRGNRYSAVRDNVLFEFGLFLGGLGLERCFHVVPRSAADLKLPSDLLGMVPLTYDDSRSGDRLLGALGAACNQIRRSIKRVILQEARAVRRPPIVESPVVRNVTLAELSHRWNSSELLEARKGVASLSMDPYSEEFDEQKPYLRKLFAFLESLADGVLSGTVAEASARTEFGHVVEKLWPWLAVHLAAPGDPDDFWVELPQVAKLYKRWSSSSSQQK